MNQKAPAINGEKKPNPVFRFLSFSRKPGWDIAILGTAGALILTVVIYAVVVGGSSGTRIQYSPADIVYGEKIHAVHDMAAEDTSLPANFSSKESNSKPVIQVSEKFYDFGDVGPHQVLTRTFVIANAGQSPLLIRRAYTTCGCTVADFTAAVIPPGKVALMTLHFDTGYHDLSGTTVRRGVMIETNDPDLPIQEIWIQASIR